MGLVPDRDCTHFECCLLFPHVALTCDGAQSKEGSEHIPGSGAYQRRGASIFSFRGRQCPIGRNTGRRRTQGL
eukprot:3230727-Pyramimonas_sp.AAC.2